MGENVQESSGGEKSLLQRLQGGANGSDTGSSHERVRLYTSVVLKCGSESSKIMLAAAAAAASFQQRGSINEKQNYFFYNFLT